MDDPKRDYGYSIKILAERAGKHALASKGEELKAKAVQAIVQKAPEPVKKLMDKAPDDLKKKLKKFGI